MDHHSITKPIVQNIYVVDCTYCTERKFVAVSIKLAELTHTERESG